MLLHRPYQDLQNLKFSCLYLIPFSHEVVPQKASGRGGGAGRGSGRIPHFNWSIYRGGNFFFFFFEPWVKLDEKSIDNGLEVRKFLVVCLFWGGCHHPNDYVTDLNFDKLKLLHLCQLTTHQNGWIAMMLPKLGFSR